jgi:hypothetical protein
MDKRIVRWLALLVVASVATASAQSKVGTASTALPFGPSVTANGMAGIGLASRGESDFTINPAFLGFFDRSASAACYPVWAEPHLISSEPGFFAASAVVAPLRLGSRSNSRLQFSAGFNWQELKNSLYEVTYAGTFRHQFITRTTQVALGASYHWIVDVGCGVAWRRLFYKDEFAGRSFSATSYDFGVAARAPLTDRMPVDRSWSEGPLFVNLIGSAVWTGYGPEITTGTGKYPQAHGRRYGLAAELAYRWLSLCPAIEREASPGYYSTIMRYGGELALADMLSLRGGKIDYREQDYLGSDQVTFGFGLSTHGLKRLVWPQGETAPTTPWWRRFDVEFSFALMCDADELVEATELYELRLTY